MPSCGSSAPFNSPKGGGLNSTMPAFSESFLFFNSLFAESRNKVDRAEIKVWQSNTAPLQNPERSRKAGEG